MISRITVSLFREDMSEVVRRVSETGERILLMKHGDPVAALMSMQDLEELEQLRLLYKTLLARRAAA